MNAGVNGTFGAIGGGVADSMNNGWKIDDGWDLSGAMTGGFVAGTVGGRAGPAGGTIARALGQMPTGGVAKVSTIGLSSGGSAAGSMTTDLVGGDDINVRGAVVSGVVGGGVSALPLDRFPGVGVDGVDTLRQMGVFHPRSLSGAFDLSSTKTRGLWLEAGTGSFVGFWADAATERLK